MVTVYVGLGANLGNREANLRMALGAMTRLARVAGVSSLYRSAPVGPEGTEAEQPDYYNAACCIETGLEPVPLLRFLKGIEHEIGRRPGRERWAPRPVDLDILLYDELVVDDGELVVPHPRMHERAFVLVPLAEVAADVVHPIVGRDIGELAREVGSGGVEKVAERGWDGIVGRPQERVRI